MRPSGGMQNSHPDSTSNMHHPSIMTAQDGITIPPVVLVPCSVVAIARSFCSCTYDGDGRPPDRRVGPK